MNEPAPRPVLVHVPPTRAQWAAAIARDRELASQRRMEARQRELIRATEHKGQAMTTNNPRPQ